MYNKVYDKIKKIIKNNYKDIVFLLLFYLIITYPLNYYIITGGDISNINSRVKVYNNKKDSGSLNLAYVSELKGNVLTYSLSYIIPSWERESVNDYKYDSSETKDNIEFRSMINLKSANAKAIRIAYDLANKEYNVVDKHFYITCVLNKYNNKLKVKDEILSIDNKTFDNVLEIKNYINSLNKDDIVVFKIKRNNNEKEIKVKVYEEDNKLIVGIIIDMVVDYDTNPKVDISFNKDESGPSAGLATTLYIYNKLIDDDLINKKKIVVTGTIEDDHSVGTIGGVEYKLLGAVKNKADIIIVPNGKNYNTCKKLKKKKKLKIKIIGVSSIEDAINKLENLK